MAMLYDERGHISRQPEVLALLREALVIELGTCLTGAELDVQEWGAGGSVHFSARWAETGAPALVKVGASPKEVHWCKVISQRAPDLSPTLFASGLTLADLPMSWTVTERIKHCCMGPQYLGAEFPMMLEAAVRFQKATRGLPPEGIATLDEELLTQWLEAGLRKGPPGPAQELLDRVHQDFQWVCDVCEFEVCHGDVQMCNGLTRHDPPAYGPLLLIDPQPIVQPWAFDAGYLQVINSINKSRHGFMGLIPLMGAFRATHSMTTPHWRMVDRLSAIVLGWFAVKQWARAGERQDIPDYVEMTEHYISQTVTIGDG